MLGGWEKEMGTKSSGASWHFLLHVFALVFSGGDSGYKQKIELHAGRKEACGDGCGSGMLGKSFICFWLRGRAMGF